MAQKVLYSIASSLGTGIGKTAEKQVEAGESHGFDVETRTVEDFPELKSRPGVEKDNLFDALSTLQMGNHDLFHGWSQHSLFQMLLSRDMARGQVLVRSSTHILKQKEIMEKEYGKLGVDRPGVPPAAVRKELLEYEVADKIMVPSKFCKESFEKYGLGKKTVVNGFGVDTERFTATEPSMGNGLTAGFVGGNLARKGLIYVVEAVKGLDIDLKVAGHEQLPFPVPGNVEAVGYVPDIEQFYREIDCLVLPSLEEGQALAVWEAMASGLPVVVSTRTGFREVVQDGVQGFLTKPRDVEGLRNGLKQLRGGEVRVEMGEAARELAEKNPWEKHGERTVKVWNDLLTASGK